MRQENRILLVCPKSIISPPRRFTVLGKLSLLTAFQYNVDVKVSNLAQASSLLYHSYISSPLYGTGTNNHHLPTVNWVGTLHPQRANERLTTIGFYIHPPSSSCRTTPLLLGPYNGRPACLSISITPSRGVCGNSFTQNKTLVVPDVESYPGHIGTLCLLCVEGEEQADKAACDGLTKSEIVIPLYIGDKTRPVGVLDLDSTVLGTFDHDDQVGLEGIAEILSKACEWA
jgi:L-methionine (R)-S-oxide reductase